MTKRTDTQKRFKQLLDNARKRNKANTKLWKKHGEVRLNPDKSIDEICIDNCDIHIEQMSDGHWWIGVYAGIRSGPHKNRKDVMHIRLFHKQDKPVVINCETDDGLITEGYFGR